MGIFIKIIEIYFLICLFVLVIVTIKNIRELNYHNWTWYFREINWKNIALAPFLLLYILWEEL